VRRHSVGVVVAVVVAAVALPLAGCGGESDEDAQSLADKSLVDVSDLPDPVLTPEDVAAAEGSPERAYLTYYQDAQFQDLASAVDRFAPGTVDAVGLSLLSQAIRSQITLMRGTEPSFIDEARSEPDLVSLRYALKGSDDQPVTATAVLRKQGGDWEIVYDSFLDGAIGSVAESRAQARIDPAASVSSIEALRAGSAAGRLQARYLEQLKAEG
jgi:hypothetical protein